MRLVGRWPARWSPAPGWRWARGVRSAASDLVHLHSNGFIIEVGQFLAARYRKPYVITLYGTDVWHHDPARHARFARVVRDARAACSTAKVCSTSRRGLGLAPDPSIVIYAPVPSTFHAVDADARQSASRVTSASRTGPLLLTVKRLHPVGGHEDLLRALPAILRERPDAQLWLAGEGELRPALEALTRDLASGRTCAFSASSTTTSCGATMPRPICSCCRHASSPGAR